MEAKGNHVHDRVWVYAAVWVVSYVGSLFALKSLNIPTAAGIVLTVVTVMAFGLFVYKYYRSIFFMDEVHVKIHMEAIVIAFSLGLLLLMTLGLVDLFVDLNPEDWSYRLLVPILIAFYLMGYFISTRKYSVDHEEHD